ncbi:hypothetical protein [Tahibacter amnicola]|uniref:Lipoprotein n=1 Tax=Tahibacter amnicola TaxID=2976241 RepID=A0ABY6BE82_9GAMM|nr:hypothetical protein [Tahibacter amnicola]UXI68159.1 hypothetical protein N4264_00455 [Tahibacter amnicola]
MKRSYNALFLAVLMTLGSGCASTRMLKAPVAQDESTPAVFGTASTEEVSLRIDHVVWRNGPGSWSRKAYWDEYRVSVENHTDMPLRIEGVSLVDPLGTTVAATSERRELASQSKRNIRRYRDSGMKVKPGAAPAASIAVGTGLALGGTAVAGSVAATGFMGASGSSTVLAVGAGAALGGVTLVGVGIDRAIQNGKIQHALDARTLNQDPVPANGEREGSVFFPVVAAPHQLVLRYRTAEGQARELAVDLSPVLGGLHVATQ